ncbi:hypothetical protein IW262DRAFT_1357830 [Armillaria fumosa]|nr:hypothetical protein IW262DRAFT_1357830 [Armillaria fumosa]
MASLSDQIDRLSRTSKATAIAAADIAVSPDVAPFSTAVLDSQLGDLIRDVDPSELGLFSLVVPHPEQDARGDIPKLARSGFPGATPLKPTTRREVDPEVYAHAALKYIDRYQAIRPMPRAYSQVVALLEEIQLARDGIQETTELLQSNQFTDGPSIKSMIDNEERSLHHYEKKLDALKKRKDLIGTQVKRTARATSTGKKSAPPRPITPVAPSHTDEEESFWATPGRAFASENLLHEQVDIGDLSVASMSSPSVPSPSTRTRRRSTPQPQPLVEVTEPQDACESRDQSSVLEDAIDKTIQVAATPASSSPEHLAGNVPVAHVPEPETPGTKARLRINTEVERIVAKIWATMGDVIMPGHPYRTADDGSKPPRAKQTIAHLQSMSALVPTPSSPSQSSLLSVDIAPSQPTPQQILTAHLLVTLLSCPPKFSMPLNKVKESLAAKASTGGSAILVAGQGTTRVLYGCVAKRLIKIDRGGGEQVVKFDV